MKDQILYGIRDKVTKKVWSTHRGKYFWTSTGAAKNAYVGQEGRDYRQDVRAGYFDRVDCKYEVYPLGVLKWNPINGTP